MTFRTFAVAENLPFDEALTDYLRSLTIGSQL